MKHLSKLLALVLALVLVLSLSATAFAEGSNSITVNGAKKDETYKVYKMLDLSVDETKNAFTYKLNAKWSTFFKTGEGAAYVGIDTQEHVTWLTGKDTAPQMESFGKSAATYATSLSPIATQTPTADGSIMFTGLEPGYYLITSTNGTLAIVDTTPTAPDAEVNEKNADPTVVKSVRTGEVGNYSQTNSAQIGDTIGFEIVIAAQKGAKDYILHDTMNESLSLNPNSFKVVVGTSELETSKYNIVTNNLTDSCSFHITFTEDYLNTITGNTPIIVTYSAILNEKAADLAGKTNEAWLTWGQASRTVSSVTTTSTHKFEVLKYKNGDINKAHLAGATFRLKDVTGKVVKLVKISDTEYRVAMNTEQNTVDQFTTVDSGNIVIKGVMAETYTLEELQAPAGYNKLSQPREAPVTTDNNLVVEVENSTGTELPSTGGIGTTIFYIVGSILVIGAVVLLVTKKRMNTDN